MNYFFTHSLDIESETWIKHQIAIGTFGTIHNSNCRTGKAYFGIGKLAPSYKEYTRPWKLLGNHSYHESIQDGSVFVEDDLLTKEDCFSEDLMTRLRVSMRFRYCIN